MNGYLSGMYTTLAWVDKLLDSGDVEAVRKRLGEARKYIDRDLARGFEITLEVDRDIAEGKFKSK